MNLQEEIALYQFAQGVHSEADLLADFSQLDECGKMRRFLHLNWLVRQLKPIDADMEQAMTDSSLTYTDVSDVFPQPNQLKICINPIVHIPQSKSEKAYMLLLYVFRLAYQRHYTLGDPANWHYWDLSSPEVVQNVLTRYQEALEKVYTNASFRSEFASIAKLWYERKTMAQAKLQEADSDRQTTFNFLNYDEMLTVSLKICDDKQAQAIGMLRHSVEKAIAVQYGLDTEQTQKIVFDVIKRHLRETYNTDDFLGE